MSVAAISNIASLAGAGNTSVLAATGVPSGTGAATVGTAKASAASAAAGLSSLSNVTTVVTMADGETVTTVRNKANEIVSISTTPATRPPEIAAAQSSSALPGSKVDLLA